MKTFLLFLLLQSFFVYRQTWGFDISPYFTPCSAKDPQISECVKTKGQKLIPLVAGGIKELNLAALDPLLTPKITFTDNTGGNNLIINYKNVEQTGFSVIQIENSDVDLLHGVMTFKLKYPRIIFTADYDAKGKFYDFNLEGNGKANISVWNAFSSFVLKYRVVDDHMKIKSIIIGFSFDKIFLDYTNLIINGDKELMKHHRTTPDRQGLHPGGQLPFKRDEKLILLHLKCEADHFLSLAQNLPKAFDK